MRLASFLVLSLALVACRKPPADEDGDGSPVGVDCDDTNAAVNPDAVEICNGIDDNCNGIIDADATDMTTFYADGDGDGYGNAGAPTQACAASDGIVADGTDCNDTSADYHPGASEADCTDPNDYNCDGSAGYADADHDGFAACKDCDDGDAAISPVATEICDGVDDDCDGTTDQGAIDALTWYTDADADGFGDPAAPVRACAQPAGAVDNSADCNDSVGAIHPGATETCDSVDQNCNAVVDENATDATTWYADVDKDGYAGAGVSTVACVAPAGYLATADDCDDLDPTVNPSTVWYADQDRDGFGAPNVSQTICAQPAGYVENSDDCDDTNGAISPDTVWYRDGDGDGHGVLSATQTGCARPAGYAAVADDCDDASAARFPGNPEVCDHLDNNCDGIADEAGTTGEKTWYADVDADGYGGTTTSVGCFAPAGSWSATGGDCNDFDQTFSPGAAEACDELDHNCDGAVDHDVDGDGYADSWCGGSDCDDTKATINPSLDGGCDCVAANDGTGHGPLCPAETCRDILLAGDSHGNGLYWLYPDGGSTSKAFRAQCDMTQNGGGWTLMGDYSSQLELFNWDPTKNQLQNTSGGATLSDPPVLDGTIKGHVAYSDFAEDGQDLRLDCRPTPNASWYREVTPLFADYAEGDVGVYGATRWGEITTGGEGRSYHWSCGSVTPGGATWNGIALCAGNGGSFANHRVSLNFNRSSSSYGGGLSIGCNGTGADDGKSVNYEARVWTRRVRPTLLGSWDFDGGYDDASGNGYNGTPVGNATLEPGHVGFAMRTSGVGGASAPTTGVVVLPSIQPTEAIAVSAWIKSNTAGKYLGVWQMVSKYYGYILGTASVDANNMCFIVYTSRGWEYGSCYNVPDPEAWHHFVGTYDSGSGVKRLYVDGVLQGTSKIPPGLLIAADAGPIDLGDRECCNHGNFDGWIDQVRIYDQPLSSTEAGALFRGLEP